MKTNEKPPSNRKIKCLIIVASLVLIERSLMISGIKAVPEQYLPSVLKKHQSIFRRVHPTLGLVSYGALLYSIMCFMLFQAKTFSDFAEVAAFFVGALVVLTFYTSFAWQSVKVLELVADLKDTVEQSKLKIKIVIKFRNRPKTYKKKNIKNSKDLLKIPQFGIADYK